MNVTSLFCITTVLIVVPDQLMCSRRPQVQCCGSSDTTLDAVCRSVQSEMKDLQEAVRSISTTIMDIGYRSPGSATSNAADVEIVDGDGTPHV